MLVRAAAAGLPPHAQAIAAGYVLEKQVDRPTAAA
jgi:hypothetical protein